MFVLGSVKGHKFRGGFRKLRVCGLGPIPSVLEPRSVKQKPPTTLLQQFTTLPSIRCPKPTTYFGNKNQASLLTTCFWRMARLAGHSRPFTAPGEGCESMEKTKQTIKHNYIRGGQVDKQTTHVLTRMKTTLHIYIYISVYICAHTHMHDHACMCTHPCMHSYMRI